MAFQNLNPTIPVVEFSPELSEPLSFGPTSPLLLFPVRLETRFFPAADGGSELRVRVYPDKVHINTHEPGLTDQEIIWGKHFWEQTWHAGDDMAARKLAWRQLVERFDAGRAAWIARALRPTNPKDRPAQFVPNDRPLPTAINFPDVATKDAAWTRAPFTEVLPNRWQVFGYAGGQLIVHASGNPIKPQLATGPDPSAPNPEATEGELAIDSGIKWMVDFEAAEKEGMGIRVPLTPDQARGFDILLVFGTKAAPDLTDDTSRLVQLFDAHHYTDGLNFVVQGTPSNNTPEAPSGFNSRDPGAEQSYAVERGTTPIPDTGSNARVLAAALGLHDSLAATFANLANSNATEQPDARHMNRALWPATWGYFLAQMMGVNVREETTLTSEDLRWARQHFIEYVRASGPLPAIRVGKQPYGILPVTSLNAWKAKAGHEAEYTRDAALKDFLIKLREIWRQKLFQVPRVGRSGNPDQDFSEIFAMDGISSNYGIRHLMGENYLRRFWSYLTAENQNFWWLYQKFLTRPLLAQLGLNWNARLASATYSGWHLPLTGIVVQADSSSEETLLSPNFVQLLLAETDIEKIRQQDFPEPKPQGLLYAVLRHAMLLEYRAAATNLLFDEQSIAYWVTNSEPELIGPPEFTGFVGKIPTPWELLKQALPGAGAGSIGDFLGSLKTAPADQNLATRVSTLLEFRTSLEYLQTLSAAKLQRLFAGTLDLCSHRLDAWITSFATKRLAEMRAEKPGGVLLGGYGWVMNLNPTPTPPAAPGQTGTIFLPPGNPGFTHTPSLAQASTVAVLRSGHLTHSDDEKTELLTIDLSSQRVRLAERLLDGVRQGQPLGALLGYRFERRLQDDLLGQFIPFFRELAPLVARKDPQTNDPAVPLPVESIAANNVVDGLLLQRKWNPIKGLLLPGNPSAQRLLVLFNELKDKPAFDQNQADTMQAELNALDDSVDAVSDALLAETVHHAVQGNPLRTASTVDAISRGEAPPPELEVVKTPRSGVALTYRLVALFSGQSELPPGWGPPAVSHRADAEPVLNAWVASLLGDPSRVRCLIERFNSASSEVVETREMKLSELQLSPLDFIYASDGGRDAQPSEIERRIFNLMKQRADGFAANADLRINPGRDPHWTSKDVSYGEFGELVRTARKLVTSTRGIEASELAPPEQNQSPGVNLTELQARAAKATAALSDAQTEVKALLDKPGDANPQSLREIILRSAAFGIAGAVPVSSAGNEPSDHDALLPQASSIAKELADRMDKVAALKTEPAASANEIDKVNHEIARLRAVFGEAFVVLPQFSLGDTSELEKALADSDQIQDDEPMAVVTWFQRASRVREGVARLADSLRYAEVLETGAGLNLSIAQLPYQQNDHWVGLPAKSGNDLSLSRFSLIVQSAPAIDIKQPLTGLLIDEWVELVPGTSETTGLVFQYDQPDAAPPQSILLAVPPDLDQPWNLWSLQQVLLETLDLARLRAVDLDALSELGHYLPALYFAVNTDRDTVSTDFMPLKR
jgi:hypothetical protein